MKIKVFYAFFFVSLLGVSSTFAQQINQIQRGQRGYTPPPIQQDPKARAVDDTLADIDEKMALYTEEFSLDEFEAAVMRNYIVEFEQGKMATMRVENMEYEVRLQTIKKLEEKLSTDLTVFLTEEEIGRFGELHFVDGNKRKKRKDRKKKKKNTEG